MDFNSRQRNTFPPRMDERSLGDTYTRNSYARGNQGFCDRVDREFDYRRNRGFVDRGNRFGRRGFGDRGGGRFGDRGNRQVIHRSNSRSDDRGIRDFGQGLQNQYDNRRHHPYSYSNKGRVEDIPDLTTDVDQSLYKSPLEMKIEKLVSAVQSQGPILGQLILIQSNIEDSRNVLGNACQSVPGCKLEVKENHVRKLHELLINDVMFAEGTFENKSIAKVELTRIAVDKLKKTCFYITKRDNFEEVNTGEKTNAEDSNTKPTNMEGSKAFQMMLKMGWGGKGLGAQEQGQEKAIAETIVENITKEGLGSKNVIAEVDTILRDFARSTKLNTLAFNSSFTKEERAQIHIIAAKYNLSTKSVGKNENRRITIKKKISKWDLVKELLRVGLENDSYKLEIPAEFSHLWQEESSP